MFIIAPSRIARPRAALLFYPATWESRLHDTPDFGFSHQGWQPIEKGDSPCRHYRFVAENSLIGKGQSQYRSARYLPGADPAASGFGLGTAGIV
jgi:hypothetical protein